MKTANSPLRRTGGILLSSLLAVLVTVTGLGLSAKSGAQDTPSKTLATGTGLPLAANAPETYTVKRGDTLWDISKVFLSQPWYWPELWYLNPQIQNPHLIFPGDVLALVNVDGQTRLTMQQRGAEGERIIAGGAGRLSPRVRSEPLSQAVTSIPYDVVAAFMGRPSVLTKEQVKTAPYLINIRDKHLLGGAGDEVYVRGIKDAMEGEHLNIVHVEEPLKDPESGDLLGYRGIHVGSGAVATTGDPAKLRILDSSREALPGDKVLPIDTSIEMDFVPHAPTTDVDGTIFAVNGITMVGQYQVVTINRGAQHGLEAGQILAIYQKSGAVRDRYSDGRSATPGSGGRKGFLGKRVKLPDERVGVVMVFKAYDRMSYGLIMETTHPVVVGDFVRNP